MTSQKRWQQVGQGEFMKWTEEGQTVEGVWRGQRDGQYGPIGMVDTDHGKVSFPLHTALLDRVTDIPEGKEVQIIYLGMKATKSGNKTYKAFNVGIAVEEAHPTTVDRGAPVAGDDEVPF